MAIYRNRDSTEFIMTCKCGCNETVCIRIDTDDEDFWAYQTLLSSKYVTEQYGMFGVLKYKLKKIWSIIRNKDFYYSDIIMSKDDFKEFKDFINHVEME